MTTQNTNSIKKQEVQANQTMSPEQLKALLANVNADMLKQVLNPETVKELNKKEKKEKTWRQGKNVTPKYENNKLYLEIDLSEANIQDAKISESGKTFLIASLNTAIPGIQHNIKVNLNVYRPNGEYKESDSEKAAPVEASK